MTPAAHSGSSGGQSSPPTTTSDPLGSFTTADRKVSCSRRKRFTLAAKSPLPKSGPPLITRRVGSPPVWESITLTLCHSLRVMGNLRCGLLFQQNLSSIVWIQYAIVKPSAFKSHQEKPLPST